MSDEATLMDKAKAMILKLRDGENFDKAYANNRSSPTSKPSSCIGTT